MGQRAAKARVRPRRTLLPLAASPAPFPAGRVVYLRVGVYEFMGPRLPCWSLGRRCFCAKAVEPQWVHRPGSMSVELTTLRACVCRSESFGGVSGPEGRSSSLVLFFGSSPIPSPLFAIPSLARARSPPPLWGWRPRPPPPFLSHKVYLQQKGARIEQPREREQELERELEGKGDRPAGGRRAEEGIPTGPGWASRDAPNRTSRGGDQAWGSALRPQGPRGMEPKPPAAAET